MLSMEKVGDHWRNFIGLNLGVGGLDLVNLYVIRNWERKLSLYSGIYKAIPLEILRDTLSSVTGIVNVKHMALFYFLGIGVGAEMSEPAIFGNDYEANRDVSVCHLAVY